MVKKKNSKSQKSLKSATDKEFWDEFVKRLGTKMKQCGDKFSKDEKKKNKKCNKKWHSTYDAFGILGPLIKPIFGIICLLIIIIVLNWINLGVGSQSLNQVMNFLTSIIPLLFVVSLIIEYAKYILRTVKEIAWILSPLVHGVEITFGIWIIANIALATNFLANIEFVISITDCIFLNLIPIFIVIAVIFYIVEIIKKTIQLNC